MAEMNPLRRRMIEDMKVRNLSPATQRCYVHAVRNSPGTSSDRPTGWGWRTFGPINSTSYRPAPRGQASTWQLLRHRFSCNGLTQGASP